jgi:hypothetical protein
MSPHFPVVRPGKGLASAVFVVTGNVNRRAIRLPDRDVVEGSHVFPKAVELAGEIVWADAHFAAR